jgi:zinc-ribbon domain
MQSKEMNMIMKIMGLLALIFCLIALFGPWGNYIYAWGFSGPGYTNAFYTDFFNTGVGEVIFFGIAMIIIFILTIVALLILLLAFRDINIGRYDRFLTVGILAIAEFILYIIAVSVVTQGYTSGGAYGAGFVLILITAILCFIVYGLNKMLSSTSSQGYYQQPVYQQQPAYNQPQTQYYTHQPQQAPPPVQEPQYTQVPQQQPPVQPAPRARRQPQAAPKFCQECGSPITPNSKFCSGCGNKLI